MHWYYGYGPMTGGMVFALVRCSATRWCRAATPQTPHGTP